ncbi:MAG: T9SS type A sorting domain-containing protein [Bacteroidetes bacterium]|nr:T9SS type A sorting domain-containing protein [Bacteroidota bacterium]
MKNVYTSLLIFLAISIYSQKANAQCNWQTIINDGFEYSTIIPDLIPSTTYQNVPQTFSVHSGAKSMYMNFVNCVSGTGTCAGALVYVRTLSVCENMPVRISLWLTTTFTGGQSNMKMVIRDGNGLVLDSTANVLAPYSPTWTQYISNSVTSTTPTITFSMYTNVDGGPGNDLSCDDFKFEKCVSVSSSQAASICSNLDSLNLLSSLNNNPVTTGTWTGPSTLTNGYWGTYFNGINTQGTYIYSSTPYGTAVGCPSRIDTVVAFNSPNPVVNLPLDTTLCTTQFLSLNAGAAGITSYLWSTNATTSNIIASSSTNSTISYSVIVTNQAGCTGSDTINISFIICSGLGDDVQEIKMSIFPNPSSDFIQLQLSDPIKKDLHFLLMDVQGKVVMNELISSQQVQFSVIDFPNGMYQYRMMEENVVKATGKLMIQR